MNWCKLNLIENKNKASSTLVFHREQIINCRIGQRPRYWATSAQNYIFNANER